MNIAGIPLFQAMNQKMGYINARHAVLAQNIANADTPGYLAQDVKAPNIGASFGSMLPLATTKPGHMQAGGSNRAAFKTIEREDPAEIKPTGNNVAIEDEVQRLSMNASDYQQVTAMYRKVSSMFNTAIGKTSA